MADTSTQKACANMKIGNHTETIDFRLTRLGNYDAILGKGWLDKHKPHVDWPTNTLTLINPSTTEVHLITADGIGINT